MDRAAGSTLFRSAVSTLQATSIAIVGASERAAWPSMIYKNLRQHGYPGRIALVNPRQKEVFGERCYPSLRDLPEPVDHALVIIPATGVLDVLADGEASGVKSATVYASMIGDGDEPESKARGEWLKNFVATSRLRVSGPNCMGAYSFRERLLGYPNTDLCKLEPGSTACLFQSGGTIMFWMRSAADRGMRFSYCVTTGNEPDLGLTDYLNFVIDDPHTKQIVLFIEGIRRPEAFMHAAARALAAGKPILALKTGVTAKSQAASQSHTGAIAGDYEAYLAMCERYGVVNCGSLDDLVEVALAFEGGRLPKGPRIGFVTTSGGTVDLLYDYADAEGAAIPDFNDSTKAALLPLMQEGIAPKNPLDVGIPSTMEVTAKWCVTVANDPNIDMVAWASPMPAKDTAWGDVTPLRKILDQTDKPMIGFGRIVHQVADHHIAAQRTAGFPFLQGQVATVRALNALWFYAQRKGRVPAALSPAPPSNLTPANLAATLARYGIALPQSAVVNNAAEAAAAAARIGFPLALKIRSPDILHKTEAGGVVLDLKDAAAVEAAADNLIASARQAYPKARIDGFLVQEMVSGVEAIVGARGDPLYGPVLLVGTGGILVELAKDAALRMLPATENDVRDMIDGLKLSQLIAGFRGRPAADRTALERTALALGRFFLDHRAEIADIEINPLMVREHGAVAVDVRVLWRSEGA
jgi:acetyltransferase